jgi:hypothetical protein
MRTDADPSFQIMVQTLEKVRSYSIHFGLVICKLMRIRFRIQLITLMRIRILIFI